MIDREDESQRLLDLVEGGHATRLSAPRRYGKTSLLRRLGKEAELIGMNYVEVDFYGVLSAADVIARIEEAYARLRSPLKRLVVSAVASLRPRVSVGAGPVKVEADPAAASIRGGKLLTGLLDLPMTLFEQNGTKTVVAFDEFQELLSIGGGIDGLFRSRIQRHGEAAGYVFAGSHPGLMEQLFGERERPFFGQARAFRLDPLTDSDLADYIGARFEDSNRDAGPALEALLEMAQGHPQRAMLLAHHLWEHTPPEGEATPETWQETVESVFSEHGEAFAATWDSLSGKEQAVLAAVTMSPDPLFGKRTMERFNLSHGGAQHAREKLAHMGHLHAVDGNWQLVDPLLAEWILRLERPTSRFAL
jgi:hypothetical protein